MADVNNISDKQKKFCDEYFKDFNGTQAAIRAGYSKRTANEQSSQLLAKLNIQQYIAAKKQRLAEKSEISLDMVLEGYRKLAFFDSRKFYDENGNILNVPDLDDETAFALSGFEVMEEKGGNGKGEQVVLGYTKKIKMSDRRAALDSICKVLGYNAPAKIAQTDSAGEDVERLPIIPDNKLDELIKSINSLGKH